MRKILNILLLVLTLTTFVALSSYLVYSHFHERLDDVTLSISRNNDDGFVDYDDTYELIMNICDTANNTQLNMIPLDSVVEVLEANPWVVDVEAEINLSAVLDVKIKECEPVMRVYNKKGKSVYIDNDGNVFPTNNDYVRHLLIANGNIDFPNDVYENVNGETLSDTDLPEIFSLMKEVMADDYSRCCVKQIYKDKKKNYIFSLNNTNIIVIFGDVNNVKDKLIKMKHFFTKMQGNPELDNYKEINLNFKNQVVCTKNK